VNIEFLRVGNTFHLSPEACYFQEFSREAIEIRPSLGAHLRPSRFNDDRYNKPHISVHFSPTDFLFVKEIKCYINDASMSDFSEIPKKRYPPNGGCVNGAHRGDGICLRILVF